MQTFDAFGTEITIGKPETINTWNTAMRDYLRFQGAPIGDLKNADDPDFLLGPVYCGVMKLLSGFDLIQTLFNETSPTHAKQQKEQATMSACILMQWKRWRRGILVRPVTSGTHALPNDRMT